MNPGDADMVIAGYALVRAELLDDDGRVQFGQLGDAVGGIYGALFVYAPNDTSGLREKWTLYTADGEYARMLTTGIGRAEMSAEVLREKFPAFESGWILAN